MARIVVPNRVINKRYYPDARYDSWTLDTVAGTLSLKLYQNHRYDRNLPDYLKTGEDRYFSIRNFTNESESFFLTDAQNINNIYGPCIFLGGWCFMIKSKYGKTQERVESNQPSLTEPYPTYRQFCLAHGNASILVAKKFVKAIEPFVDKRFSALWDYSYVSYNPEAGKLEENLTKDERKKYNNAQSKKIWARFFHEVDEDAREYLQYLQHSNNPEDAWAKGVRSSQISLQASNDDIVKKLQELAELKEKGLIDEEEFKSAKNKLLE